MDSIQTKAESEVLKSFGRSEEEADARPYYQALGGSPIVSFRLSTQELENGARGVPDARVAVQVPENHFAGAGLDLHLRILNSRSANLCVRRIGCLKCHAGARGPHSIVALKFRMPEKYHGRPKVAITDMDRFAMREILGQSAKLTYL